MARLVTLDVTNTCIGITHSVGHHYVSDHSSQVADMKLNLAINARVLLKPSVIDEVFCCLQARVARKYGLFLNYEDLNRRFRLIPYSPFNMRVRNIRSYRLSFKETSSSFPCFGRIHNLSSQQWWQKVLFIHFIDYMIVAMWSDVGSR